MVYTGQRQWSRYEETAYRTARREGMPVGAAFTRALSERVAHRILPPMDTFDGPTSTSWRVNATELARATSDPRTDALFGILTDGTTGERILSRVILPTDARATITVRRDDDGDPREYECYSPDDVEAWQADEWSYSLIEATVTLPDGREGIATLGGVETGAYWGVSLEAAILHTVASLISEALTDAENVPPNAPRLADTDSSECLDNGMTCSVDPTTGRCTECGGRAL
jgi:hypothetical protein